MSNSGLFKNNRVYYIPIVEDLRLSEHKDIRFWQYAMLGNVAREFFTSPNQQSTIWYKIELTAEKISTLTTHTSSNYIGFISFHPTQIKGVVELKNGNQTEKANPFYTNEVAKEALPLTTLNP